MSALTRQIHLEARRVALAWREGFAYGFMGATFLWVAVGSAVLASKW